MADVKAIIAKINNLKLTKEQQQYVALGVMLVVFSVYAYWNFGLKVVNTEIGNLQKTITEKRDNLEKAKRLKGLWEEYLQRLGRVQTATQFLARRLPNKSNYNVGIPRMTKMTLEGGVTLGAYGEDKSAKVKSEFEGFEKRVALILLAGEYHRLGEFLSRLSAEDLVYNIEDLQMIGSPDLLQQQYHVSTALAMKLVTYVDITGDKK